MTRRSSLKRSIDATDQQGSVKRRKSQKLETHQGYSTDKTYSTREITWKEQKQLGGEFTRVGKGAWPVLRILEESEDENDYRTKKYLIAWRPHPETGEDFQPEWKPSVHVSDDLIAIWERAKREEAIYQKKKSANGTARNRPVVPSSSETQAEIFEEESDAAQSPPSLLSDRSVSGLEISETQEVPVVSPRVNIPPLPVDKQEYETIESSQYSPAAAIFDHQSPDGRFNIPSNQNPAERSASSLTLAEPEVLDLFPAPVESSTRLSRALSTVSKNLTSIVDLFESSSPVLLSRSPSNTALSGVQTPQSRVGEPSPLTPSVRAQSGPKLSNIASSAEEATHLDGNPPPSRELLTQIPIPDSQVTIPKSPVRSLESEGRSVRLSSPFGVETTGPDAIPVVFAPSRRHSLIQRRAISGERLQNQGIVPETPRTISVSPRPGSPEEQPKIPSQSVSTPTQPESGIMASPGVDMAPLESSETHLFTAPSNNNLEIHDANAFTLTIHESIEDEPQSSAEISQVMTKANSSQESLSNEREVETVDGIMIPVRPLLGPNEFAVPLPAEGKVKSQYDEIIKLQKRAILRFISRTGSPGTSDISSKKTIERNTMQELLQQLNNTVTHTDLGLPMHTQYSLNSDANAAYAEYAGTKFELLGYLIDSLKEKDCSFAIFAQAGSLQDLLEEYLRMKRVTIRRHEHVGVDLSDNTPGLSIDLLTTQASKVVSLDRKPLFIIAFDVTFTSSDPQVRSLRGTFGDSLPILHLLVTNSSEHVERCVPETLTSNIRLKVVVRTTYLASRNLGGDITYVPEESDQPADGRGMDMSEFQRAVRKSPARRLYYTADVIGTVAASGGLTTDWPLPDMPELKLNELETPPKISRAGSRTPQLRITRQSTPASRAATPVAKRRLLDIEADTESKRQRLTPVRDLVDPNSVPLSDDAYEARKRVAALSTELASTKHALSIAEQDQAKLKAKAEDWERSHAELMHRFEKDRIATREAKKEKKGLESTLNNHRARDEALRDEKAALRQQLNETKAELLQARQNLTGAGGDIAQLENAQAEVRNLNSKLESSEKLVKTLRADFEFVKDQYQAASQLALDRTTEVKKLEEEVEKLKIAADDKKRSLKAMNYQTSLTMAMNKAEQFRLEAKSREAVIRKLQEENASLKSRRGVQTRGSSIQPASSPGPRSRQASPAATHLMPPSGSRASVLRHER